MALLSCIIASWIAVTAANDTSVETSEASDGSSATDIQPPGRCHPKCPTYLLGNAQCNQDCNLEACNFDHGDCLQKKEQSRRSYDDDDDFDDDDDDLQCSSGCPSVWQGDGYCDAPCDNLACGYDNGDCVTPNTATCSSRTRRMSRSEKKLEHFLGLIIQRLAITLNNNNSKTETEAGSKPRRNLLLFGLADDDDDDDWSLFGGDDDDDWSLFGGDDDDDNDFLGSLFGGDDDDDGIFGFALDIGSTVLGMVCSVCGLVLTGAQFLYNAVQCDTLACIGETALGSVVDHFTPDSVAAGLSVLELGESAVSSSEFVADSEITATCEELYGATNERCVDRSYFNIASDHGKLVFHTQNDWLDSTAHQVSVKVQDSNGGASRVVQETLGCAESMHTTSMIATEYAEGVYCVCMHDPNFAESNNLETDADKKAACMGEAAAQFAVISQSENANAVTKFLEHLNHGELEDRCVAPHIDADETAVTASQSSADDDDRFGFGFTDDDDYWPDDDDYWRDDGLGGGAIAGIVIGVLLCCGCVVFIVCNRESFDTASFA